MVQGFRVQRCRVWGFRKIGFAGAGVWGFEEFWWFRFGVFQTINPAHLELVPNQGPQRSQVWREGSGITAF